MDAYYILIFARVKTNIYAHSKKLLTKKVYALAYLAYGTAEKSVRTSVFGVHVVTPILASPTPAVRDECLYFCS